MDSSRDEDRSPRRRNHAQARVSSQLAISNQDRAVLADEISKNSVTPKSVRSRNAQPSQREQKEQAGLMRLKEAQIYLKGRFDPLNGADKKH